MEGPRSVTGHCRALGDHGYGVGYSSWTAWMLADAQERGDFEVVLCWDQSRFGRFSPQEGGHWTYLFAEAGVRLVTTDKGPIDWNDFTGWLTYSVDQHAKHQYLLNLSRDVTRGQLEAAKNGSWIGSSPYAYRIEGERKNKRLVLDDPAKIRIVQRIFREFVEERRSMSDIANRLQREGHSSPGGRGNPHHPGKSRGCCR